MAAPRPLAALFFVPALLAAQAPEGAELLAKVDRLRNPWPAFSVQLALSDGRHEQRWKVTARENGDARVEGQSDKEKGRTVLVLGDEMWLLLPNAKRPVKVTPQQRLLGPASGGDVARTRFAADYAVTARAEESVDGKACWRLDLAAKRPSISFRTARLWILKEGEAPLKAEFYLPSGKLAKTARFDAPVQTRGVRVLPRTVLQEPNGDQVELRFSEWQKASPDAALFELPTVK